MTQQNQSESLVARFSATFVKRYRITTLLFLSILVLGFLSYTQFLKIEGFPAVEVPVVFVEGSYFVNDADKVNKELTTPIEQAANELAEITRLTSTTTPVGVFIAAQFEEDISSEDASELLRDSVQKSVQLPEGAAIEYRTINAGALDGENDLIFNVSADRSIEDLQEVAEELAIEVNNHPDIAKAQVVPLIEQRLNPVTGQPFDYQSGFNRVGYRQDGPDSKDDQLVFENAISVGVVRKADIGTVELSDIVKNEVEEFRKTGELDGFNVTYGGDLSANVLDQRSSLEKNALLGLISVVILIFLLIDWRASIVGGIFIPLVFAGVFLALYLIGYSLNVISLFSLVLVLGMFVDNATVVIDAIERAKDRGLKGRTAIKHAIKEIGTSVIAGTWTTVLVFVPMMFISGVLGEFILLIPVTVITALLISLFLTLTVVPWLGNIFIRDKKEHPEKSPVRRATHSALSASSRLIKAIALRVSRYIHEYLGRRWKIGLVIVVALGLMAYGASFAQKLDFSVFPPAKDTDQIVLTLEYPTGTSIEQAEEAAQELEIILEEEAGEDLTALTYFEASDKSAMLMADLTEVGERTRTSPEIVEQLQTEADNIEGARVTIKAQSVGPPAGDFQITVRVLADTEALLEEGTADVKNFLADRELSDGENVTEVVVDRFDVLTKIDGSRFAQVQAKISDPEKTNLVLELQESIEKEYSAERLQELGLRDDAIAVDLGQEGENVDSFKSAALALMIALVVMYGLLVLQFNSFTQPLLIFLAIPFAFPVLFPALYITGNSLSFFVMLGIIALSGVVVNNTIMLVHQANLLRREGKTAREAISLAIGIRFRALLATSLTTMAGLLPLALSDPFWEPLAFTIIFGLASSVVMAVLAFPAFYVAIEGLRDLKKRRPKRRLPI